MISLKGKSLYVESKEDNKVNDIFRNLQFRLVEGEEKIMAFGCTQNNGYGTEIGISQDAYKSLITKGYYSDEKHFMCIHHNS